MKNEVEITEIKSQGRRNMLEGLATTAVAAVTAGAGGAAIAGTADSANSKKTSSNKFHSVWKKDEVALILIDYQPQMFAGVHSTPNAALIELNARYLIRSAKIFNIPVVYSTVAVKVGTNGPMVQSMRDEMPNLPIIDRTTMDAWEDPVFAAAVKATGRKRMITCALWTEICLTYSVVSMMGAGYEVMFPVDAVGGTSQLAHETAIQRLIQAGAVPNTATATIAEWFRDWNDPKAREPFHVVTAWYKGELAKINGGNK